MGKPIMSFFVGVPDGCKPGDFVHSPDQVGIVCGEFGVLGFDRAGAELAAKKLREFAMGLLGGSVDLHAPDFARGEGGTVLGAVGNAPKRRRKGKTP